MGDAGEDELDERIEGGDDLLYRVPLLEHPISINEFHAHVIGVGTGVLVTVSYFLGYEAIGFLAGSGLVGYSLFGRPFLRSLPHDAEEYERTIALKTIKWEPWHFLAAFLLGLGLTTLIAGTWPS